MKPSLRGATHLAPACPAACVITRLARATLVLALVFAATLPSSAGDRRRSQRAVGSVFGWGWELSYASPTQLSGFSGVVAVADGRHSLILKSNGTVLARGWNDHGQLGDGTITTGTSVQTPVQVSGLSDVVAVAVGESHSIALKGDGTVWTWGRNDNGQLGVAGGDQSTPVRVPSLSGVAAIAAGQQHTLALKSDGTVWAWGYNLYGQLGVSGGSSVTPVPVAALSGIVAITAGHWHSVALSSDGTVWAWGYNFDGQLGMGGVGDGSTYPYATPTPQHVMGGSFSGVAKISGYGYETLAAKSDGTVWAWGRNNFGVLGDGTTDASGTPVQAVGLSGIADVAAGLDHGMALKGDGTVWTWGYNGYGQLGNGTRDGDPHPTATQVPDLSGVVAISAGVFSSVALQSQAIGMAWGLNAQGQLGDGSDVSSSTPVQVVNLVGLKSIAAGDHFSLALDRNGAVWCWGFGATGQLGNGSTSNSSTPVQASGLAGVIAIARGYSHGLALNSDGTVSAWGANDHGELGNGTTTTSSVPVPVSDLADVVAIAAGSHHSVALKADGTVWAWGYGGLGVLGTGTFTPQQTTPVQVSGLAGVVAIAGGYFHSLAMRSDGSVWAWGYNSDGELGDGTTSNRWTPVQVTGLTGVVDVAAGSYHSLALADDGTVAAWGANAYGRLGNGTTTDSHVPVAVSALSGAAGISGGGNHSVALKSDGTVWAWGGNYYGPLGDGTVNDSSIPVQVTSLSASAPSAVAAGGAHTLALSLLPLTVTAFDQVMTYGGTVPTLTYTSDIAPLDTPPTCATSANSTSPVGTYTITCSGAAKAGYEITYVPGTLTVDSAPLTITARDGTKTYGMTLVWVLDASYPGSYITVDGLRNADAVTDITLTTAGAPAAATLGTYDIIPSAPVGTGLANYDVTFVPGTLTVTAAAGALSVIPDSQAMTYGGTVPTLTYTVSGLPDGQTLDTGATCIVPDMVAPPVGTYPISCAGAAKAGYEIAYGSATLTVNPAPLTIIADNKSMGLGSTVPLLTASYLGLVGGDTPAVVGGSVELTTNATSSSPAGTYDISFASAPALPDYTVTTVLGTLTVNPDLLTFNNNYFVTGDFAVGWVSLRGQGDETGFATGEIRIPNVGLSAPMATTVPVGADIVAAYLYWQAVEWSGFAPEANGFFRDYRITGEQLGSDLPFTPASAPAPVGGGVSTVIRMYRANVLPYLPLDADGRRLPAGPHTVRLPEGGAGLPFNSGVSLVVIYRVLSKDFPLRAIVLHDGAWVREDGLRLTVRGFYDANPDQPTRVFNMASTADGFAPLLLLSSPPAGTTGQYSEIFPAEHGTAGGVHVFSVGVNDSDDDGLLDAWESAGGYNEVSDGSWVPLPGAVNGQKDMFAQLDYMCSAVNSDGTCENSRLPQPDPVTGEDPLLMVQQAFDASGVKLHYLIGHAIQEETCHDDLAASPPRRCQFPEEPGVVGWKNGLEVFKVWARDPADCVAGNADACRPRFERGQKDSYHYVLFGRSLAVAAWNTRARTLDSIVVSNLEATITTPARALPDGSDCPRRVAISGALGAPELNGVYDVLDGDCLSNTTFRIATPGVGNWTYNKPASPADEREPMLAVISGDISSISGYSDVGGADSAVTLGKWAPDPDQPQNTKANVQAGTLMHELGHTIGLTHGGAYDTADGYALTYGGNCKPNYQSIMNYLFQIDLLPGKVLAFSGQALDTMNEEAASVTWTGTPTFPQTRWYVPWSSTALASPAKLHCDGTPILDASAMVREDHDIASPTWTPGQDINFDGQLNTALAGYDDLPNLDLRQVGATGGEYVSMAGLLSFGSGGTLTVGSGGTLAMGSGGTLTMGSGGTLVLGSGGTLTFGSGGGSIIDSGGGTVTFGSGGTYALGSGGTLAMGSGGILAFGSGGTLSMGSGGVFTMGSGGLMTMGSGGTFAMGSGGLLTMGSGGTVAMGSGGTVAMGSGGVFAMGSGGVLAMGSGGVLTMGSGGVFTMGSGGTLALGSGGTLALGSGGTLALGSGGTLALGSGGTLALGSGGTLKMGGGGVMEEMTYETANSVVRPPSEVTKTPIAGGGLRIDWQPPSFGVVAAYAVYYSVGTNAPVLVGTVSGTPPQTTFTVTSPVADAVYFVTTTVADSETGSRSSPPSDPAVLKYDQTIAFGVLPDKLHSEPEFTVSATANPSGLAVSFSAAGDCTLSGDRVSLTSVGSCTITASQPGDQEYNPAPNVSRTFEILERKKDQTISFFALPDRTYGDPDFAVSATASSGLPVSFAGAGNCTVTGETVHLTGAGSCTVTASQEGNNVYEPAPPVPQTFTIIAWTIQGFHSPVKMAEDEEPVWNVVRGGSTVPLKFNIYAGAVEQTELEAVNGGSVAVDKVSCTAGDTEDLTGGVDDTGDTSLRYDGTQFVQNWKTPKKAGLCYGLRMTARDGSVITGYFRTR